MIRIKNTWIEITEAPLSVAAAYEFVVDETCGAVDLFVGTVRNQFEGKAVAALEYHGYAEMGEKVLQTLAERAFQQWNLGKIAIHHRLGLLHLTDISVVIAVSSPHRAESFEACRFIIEEIKKDVPIWKKEHFAEGEAAWKYTNPT
ncbi:MAG: molybdenum cofactor biosynthesis protein MoaE [Gemmatimonadetes bacterium]|nr:MAG: molybdenum cofactor biosynthesis protein MoaE [Gemmatimonadota bacterium]